MPPTQDRLPLRFGRGNAKLDPGIRTFSLPAGHTCPGAHQCRSRADRTTGHVKDSVAAEFRCYAVTMEARLPSVRGSRWHNYEQLRRCESTEEMASRMLDSLSPFARVVRVHDAGDFFSQAYFDAWLVVARERPHTVFDFYTKSLRFWVARLADVGTGHTPGAVPNVVPTASRGGRDDALVGSFGLRSAAVVYSVAEAAARGLPVDHDDSHALQHGPDFALLLHGTQPPNSEAALAARSLRAEGFRGYGPRIALKVA